MILTPEERRALLGLVGLLLLGQGLALVRDEKKARPDRELSAWLTRAQAARAESAHTETGLAGVLPGLACGMQLLARKADTSESTSSFESPAPESTETARAGGERGPVRVEASSGIPPGVATSGRVAINRATARDLETLPGIGPSLAGRIVEERERSGPFLAPRDLLRVKGVGEKKLAACQDRIDWTR